MTDDELQKQYRKQTEALERKMLASNDSIIQAFREYCDSIGVEVEKGDFNFVQTIGVLANKHNLLLKLAPELEVDKDGLVSCKQLDNLFTKDKFLEGYYLAENYMIMAHPAFRRGMSRHNNWAPCFINKFWVLQESEIELYLALDLERVRINVNDSRYMEFDTWYGALFSDDIESIPDGSTYLRSPIDTPPLITSTLFRNAYALDIYWSTKETIKTFQALEFKQDNITIEKDGEIYHPVRYIHAEYDLKKEYFRHFDGAIHYYRPDDYYLRRDSNFRHNEKGSRLIKAKSEKLFKMNGVVTKEVWSMFSSHFFASNPLVVEYLTGAYPNHVTERLKRLRVRTT
ncbi:hypothetical protein [Kangiella shandongensis]|uniref:hypothetical protein n=1 Tax=Kangiella shandongensis TaxID=2763258 RepID=UPI001CBDBF03|nr:hypothetical protein [Kangiella shandongensis]